MRGHPSWTRPDTHYRLVRSETPVDVDGFKLHEPTGEVLCEECGRAALDIDWIDHADGCANAD